MFDFICGIIIIIIIVFVILAISGSNKNTKKLVELTESQTKQTTSRLSDRYCPNCGRAIPFDSNSCPYCGKVFTNFISLSETKKKENAIDESELASGRMGAKSCPSCGYENESESKFCKKCGTVL